MANATSHAVTQLLKYAEMGSFSETNAKKESKKEIMEKWLYDTYKKKIVTFF